MENSVLSFALTGVVPPVCDAEAGETRLSNPTVSQVNSSTSDGSSTGSQSPRQPVCESPRAGSGWPGW